MEIKNIKKAAQRIIKAIKNKEKIILYGDADLDGATSVIILQDSIRSLGGEISAVYFPDREIEGYGITEKGLNFLKKETPALLIALDCGIGNFKEVKLAKSLGFEVMIIDHHEILDKLPAAKIIIDPKQKDDRYPFKYFACAGVVFKLSETILGNKLTESLRRNFLELVALATIGDMMPQESENKIFIEEGLSFLKSSWRPGIKTFLEIEPFKSYPGINQKVSKIISILNIRDVKSNLPASFRLLSSYSSKEAEGIVKDLLKKAERRKEKIEEIKAEVEKRLEVKEDPIIFEGGADFDLTLISSVASSTCQKHLKPAFLYKKMMKESHGTVRVPKGINSVSLMKKCSEYLLTYGGHAQASGFRIKNENLEKFKKCLIKNLR
ncbi:MAG: DHH family phosphoesterase [Candidatus Nealsonbacteria bacterium]|nr:DHH family phosphoesterase [Candidatus Nealsonbacteria bacterium]